MGRALRGGLSRIRVRSEAIHVMATAQDKAAALTGVQLVGHRRHCGRRHVAWLSGRVAGSVRSARQPVAHHPVRHSSSPRRAAARWTGRPACRQPADSVGGYKS